jgi:hypothetical protein
MRYEIFFIGFEVFEYRQKDAPKIIDRSCRLFDKKNTLVVKRVGRSPEGREDDCFIRQLLSSLTYRTSAIRQACAPLKPHN